MEFLQSLDNATLEWFKNHRTEVGNAIMLDLTALGGNVVLPLIVTFSIGLLLALRRYQTAFFVLTVVVVGALLVEGAKSLIDRPRPPKAGLVFPLAQLPNTPSFPSGHSTLSAVVYLTLALLVAGRVRERRGCAPLFRLRLLFSLLFRGRLMFFCRHYLTYVGAGRTVRRG